MHRFYRCLVLALIGCGVLTGCGKPVDSIPLNVVLISIDTLRADHLGVYGYSFPTSPHIDAFAKDSMTFDHCLTPVPITLPSHTSMLTGLYPPHHSVRDNGTFSAPDDFPTLATILKNAGYLTYGLIGSFPLHSRFGLARGFDVWDEDFHHQKSGRLQVFFDERPAFEVARRAIALLEQERARPFFLFVHFFDVHQPWAPQEPFDRINPDLLYDGEIGVTDTAFEMILQKLRETNRWDNTIVILTADHGEGLYDHEEFSHSILLYEETTHVPLIIHVPGRAWRGRRPDTVSLVDIAPTVLDLLGIEPPEQMDGRSLIESPDPDRMVYMESLAGRLGHGWNDIRAGVVKQEKLILSSKREFYDLATDPREGHNLAPQRSEHVASAEARLRAEIEKLRLKAGAHTLETRFHAADDELRERLRALGYLSIDEPVEDLRELVDLKPGKDPRRHVGAISTMSVAANLINSGDINQALQVVNAELANDPTDKELLRYLIFAYAESGDFDRALLVFDRIGKAVERDVGLLHLRALIRWRKGDLEGARADAGKCTEMSSRTDHVLVLADILHAQGESEQALALLQSQYAKDPCSEDLALTLARLERSQKNRGGMRKAYEALLQCDSRNITALYNLGNLDMEDRHLEGAAARYRSALNLDPGYFPASYGLASIALQQGDSIRAQHLLEQVLEAAPPNSPYAKQAVAILEEF